LIHLSKIGTDGGFFCEHGNEPSRVIKFREFLHCLRHF